jgi:hypothetical protein
MFRSTKLDEESMKFFAKNYFYLPDNLSGLEEQIYTCIKLLDKLTCRGGIASGAPGGTGTDSTCSANTRESSSG